MKPIVVYRDVGYNFHCASGPAAIYEDGSEEWWIHGNNITKEVQQWITDCNINLPFDADTQLQFDLTWTYNYAAPSPGVSFFIIDG